jgi:hypothetical protein
MRRLSRFPVVFVLLTALFVTARPAAAGMVLTAAGISQGFSISTFASGFPNSGIGPIGIGFSGNSVLVGDIATGGLYVFPSHADNQTATSNLLSSQHFGGGPTDIATAGGNLYIGTKSNVIFQINGSGTILGTLATGLGAMQDLKTNPGTGHLIADNQNGQFFDINPALGNNQSVSPIFSSHNGVGVDGITLSADGKTMYVASGSSAGPAVGVYTFNGSTWSFSQNLAAGLVPGIDGLTLGFGTLGGFIYANTNFGNVYQIPLNGGAPVLIATGGSRGDFVQVDPTNNSLLLTQTDSVVRLTPPAGSGFGGGPATVPEPASLILLGFGGLGLAGWGWRRRKAAAKPLPPTA